MKYLIRFIGGPRHRQEMEVSEALFEQGEISGIDVADDEPGNELLQAFAGVDVTKKTFDIVRYRIRQKVVLDDETIGGYAARQDMTEHQVLNTLWND